jgi:nitric oxide dioxygenase
MSGSPDGDAPLVLASAGIVEIGRLLIATGATAFLCGPLAFMQSVRAQLLDAGIQPVDVHYEVFGPDTWLIN